MTPGPPTGDRRQRRHVLHFARSRRRCARGPAVRIVRMFGIGAVLQQQLHRVDVGGVGGAPERRRAALVDARLIEVVLRVPDLAVRRAFGLAPLSSSAFIRSR